jgi:hypothetical protein
MQKLKIGPESARGAYSTLLKRISLPMNCANAFGLISPRTLERNGNAQKRSHGHDRVA